MRPSQAWRRRGWANLSGGTDRIVPRWIPVQDALRAVAARVGSTALAEQNLRRELKEGTIRARAANALIREPGQARRRKEKDVVIPREFWGSAHINWSQGSGERIQRDNAGSIRSHWTVQDVLVCEDEVQEGLETVKVETASEERRPKSTPAPSAPRDVTPSKRGRPLKYDWISLAGYMAAYVVEYDYPPQSEIVKIIAEWFEGKGEVPDKPDIERFAEGLLAAKDSFKRTRKN